MSSQRLLLISSSQVYGHEYLGHCLPEIVSFLRPDKPDILFIPYAKKDHDAYAATICAGFKRAGLRVKSIHRTDDPVRAVQQAQAIYTGGGNTFLLLTTLYTLKLLDPIRERVRQGIPYMGASAGSNIAGLTIQTTNDMPIIYPPSFEALGLVPFTINPHYIDPLPEELQAGETRAERIHEFHEWNNNPVVGLRNSGMLLIENDSILIKGEAGVSLFRKAQPPQEFVPGDRLDFLLK